MAGLSMGKIIIGVLFLSLVLGFTLIYTERVSFSPSLLTIFSSQMVIDEDSQTVKIGLGGELSYKEGYIKVNAVYCGFGPENEYAIVQTDAVSNPQKIEVGKRVKISGDVFELEETNCDDEYAKYIVLKKLSRLNREERPNALSN